MAPRWKALYVLARKRGLAPAEAEDAVQGFLARMIEGDSLPGWIPGAGGCAPTSRPPLPTTW